MGLRCMSMQHEGVRLSIVMLMVVVVALILQRINKRLKRFFAIIVVDQQYAFSFHFLDENYAHKFLIKTVSQFSIN